MKFMNYFLHTREQLIDFTENRIAETREISENISSGVDDHGIIISMTIEHAKETGGLQELAYRKMSQETASHTRQQELSPKETTHAYSRL